MYLPGELVPFSSTARASIARKRAPKPIGPKWPQKNASRMVMMSGTHRYIASMIGIRRNNRTKTRNAIKRPGVILGRTKGELYESHGMIVPLDEVRTRISGNRGSRRLTSR